MNAMPPDPAFRGDGWREEWLARLDATPPWLFEWLRQQHDGPYWRPGSLAPDYDAIEAAILNVGGWMDSYVDAALRMQAACTAPSRSLVGPWVHDWPSSATPGPNLDELHEVVRFFDRWLRGIPNGSDLEPALTWFERDYAEPEPFATVLPWPLAGREPPTRIRPSRHARGTWSAVTCRSWAASRAHRRRAEGTDRYVHRPTVGTSGSLSWGAGGGPNGLARDLRPDEVFGPTYTSAPLTEPLSVLGVPEVVLHLAVSAPVATAVVRLTDVAPDGTSAQVSAGILNLTHRRSHEHPEALAPGRTEEIRVPMRPAGYRFAAGHRIRVSVASSAWPVIWPSPYPAEFELHHGPATPSRLVLPVVPPAGGPGDVPVPVFKTTATGRSRRRPRRALRRADLADHDRRRSPAASRSRSTRAARRRSTTADGCTPPRR